MDNEGRIESSNTSGSPQHSDVADETQRRLESIRITEYLEIDERPVFVLDLTSTTKSTPVFCNASLREIPLLLLRIGQGGVGSIDARDLKYASFVDWATQRNGSHNFLFTTYCGVKWTAKTLRKRWRIISGEVGIQTVDHGTRRSTEIMPLSRAQTGLEQRPKPQPRTVLPLTESIDAQITAFKLRREATSMMAAAQSVSPASDLSMDERYSPWSSQSGLTDFTRLSDSLALSPHLKLVTSFDWASTELGAMATWPNDLRRMANLLMCDARPASMYWGKSRTMLYNEPYIRVLGQKHPRMMGKTFSDAWAEVANEFSPAFQHAYDTGKSYVIDDARFYIERQRHGDLEETYFSIAIIPIITDSGEVAYYNPVYEVTKQLLADRRMAFLLRVSQHFSSSREPKDFWPQLLRALDADHLDLPFSILYSAGSDTIESLSESSELSQQQRSWVLEGTVHVTNSSEIPNRITNEQSMEAFLPDFATLAKKKSPTLLSKEDGSLPCSIAKNITIEMDGEVPCEAAVFLPIRSTGDNILGFLLVGINPRRSFDDDYRIFMELLTRQLATAMATAVLFEDEIRRGQIAAEQATRDKNLLSKKLAITTHEAREVETRFRRMADLAPVGMFHIDSAGVIIYANEDYYNMTEHPRNVAYAMSWYGVLKEDDHAVMDKEWTTLLSGEPVNFEIRLKRPFVAEESIDGEKVGGSAWILAAAYPEKREDGTVVGVLGCITDISRQKWMEGFQQRRLLEAVELKRQQENFIDMTSHEMRNPLSAIIQCADWISTSLAEFGGDSHNVTLPRELLAGHADAAQTVVLCAQHQKRIIDDILTLSKLDSELLLITPVEVRPVRVVEDALKMFDSELQKTDIALRFVLDPSYTSLDVEWVRLDPSRLLQVLINLTTNAIKFTQPEKRRQITITLYASAAPPISMNGIDYLPRATSRKDLSLGSAWGTGETIFLRIEVNDTGRGLTEDERNLLFKRFSQTSPRTHVQYGGSGLGLFISRELTELQGGQIGVASQAGVGSTFTFYVRARRCEAPASELKTIGNQAIDMRAQTRVITPSAVARIQNGTNISTMSEEPKIVRQKHVLIVEDNIVNQKVLSKQLRSAGCIVHVANHGLEALSFLATTTFSSTASNPVALDIVLMDLEMPVMDGLTCVRQIREMEQNGEVRGRVPVIAVTANARSAQIAEAKEAGMDSVVTKPFRIPELLPELDKQINASRASQAMKRPSEAERSYSAPPVLNQ